MLRNLSIRDVVLIGRLDIAFRDGLNVLTGETGAGKSILLDALGLALGVRAEARLVRHGAEQAAVTAAFDLPADHPAVLLVAEQGIEGEDGQVILRRTLGKDGRSRAFVNDQPVSVALLRQIGEALVEIHGQFESQRLLNPASHRDLLDAFGALNDQVAGTRRRYRAWREAQVACEQAAADVAKARRDEDYLRHAAGELADLAPQPGEEKSLAEDRAMLMHGEQIVAAMNEAAGALTGHRGAESILQSALRALEKVVGKAEGRLDATVAALTRAYDDLAEATGLLEKASASVDLDPRRLEKVEERLFALRALARKHAVDCDELPALQARLAAELVSLEDGGANLVRLRKAESEARQAYDDSADGLSRARSQAAGRLDKAVAAELEPLKLGRAKFSTRVEPLEEAQWHEAGKDRVAFEVATNPGSPPGPLARIASGGELARFMLALKAVLAQADPVPTLVFDEVDAGIGGATASAVGHRLAALGQQVQVLVVTHSPQVAALGVHHWQVAKREDKTGVFTVIEALGADERREEIARMLAGAAVTAEARAAAEALLGSR
ncbi:MAG: DNA repair protein RecN [Magnetospirillum sp. WYHS-4]